MRIGRSEGRRPGIAHHGEAAILFAVGGYKFAIAAIDVDEIRDLQGLKPIGMASAGRRVQHTIERDRRTYAVVDGSIHFGLLPSKPSRLLILRKGRVAFSVDSIDRMAEITPMVALPRAFKGEERKWYRGLALIDELVVPVVNADAILSEGKAALAEAGKGAASA